MNIKVKAFLITIRNLLIPPALIVGTLALISAIAIVARYWEIVVIVAMGFAVCGALYLAYLHELEKLTNKNNNEHEE